MAEEVQANRGSSTDDENIFKPGDKVWLYTPVVHEGESKKFATFWDGPHTVLDTPSPVNSIIDVKGKHQRIHNSRLKPIHKNNGYPRLEEYNHDFPEDLRLDEALDENHDEVVEQVHVDSEPVPDVTNITEFNTDVTNAMEIDNTNTIDAHSPTPELHTPDTPLTDGNNITHLPHDDDEIPDEVIDGEDYFEVEEILDAQLAPNDKKRGRPQWKYLVKWKSFGPERNSWEPRTSLHANLIQEYHNLHPELKEIRPHKKSKK